MRQASTIDLSQLPPPALIDALDAESIISAAIADYRSRWPEFSAVIESEPVLKFIEVLAYRETLLRNLVNRKARATMLAFAFGTDLDHIGARFGVSRLVIAAGSPAVMEDDERFRRRIQLAPEAFSVAGPAGAYEYWALTAEPSLSDVHAYSPSQARGEVRVVVAASRGAEVSDEQLSRLSQLFEREDIVPLTDIVSVRRAAVKTYDVTLSLIIERGPDPEEIRRTAEQRVLAYAAERRSIGETVFWVGLVAAAKQSGASNVEMTQPVADIACLDGEIAEIGAISISAEVV